ncbi:MAG: histidine kinase [Flavobacteriaceae bacterium]|nr:MAG: histidine kinase [Flavobacteriaceae bacterium]
MNMNKITTRISWQELFFQFVLYILVLLFYSFDRNDPGITLAQLVFFLLYACASVFITYFLMPKFLYNKKYWHFFGFVVMVLLIVIIAEELLEVVFYPGTPRANFTGIYFAIFNVLPIIAILSGFKFAWDAIGKQSEVEKLKTTMQESELQFLKSQINPHFLFNNLNNLYSYAIELSPKTPTIILELSSVLRYMLYECKERFVPLSKEIEQLENFTQLNELQIEERGKVSFKATAIKPGYQIAPLILLVFIENAFKHSQSGQSSNIRIDVDIKMDGDTLHFNCKNNFQPITETENLTKGIGLDNVKKRLQLLYPNAHELKINETPDKFEVDLKMELQKISLK